MKNLKYWYHFSSVLVLVLLLAACDSGGSGSGTTQQAVPDTLEPAPTSLSGTVADGYLSGARVFLDRNGNRTYDSGEPMAMSAAGGVFTLSINAGEGARYPVVVEVIAGETIDEDTGRPVADSYLLEAPPGRWQFVSPLTTLVNQEMNKNPTMTLQKAELNVKRQLGIDDEISLFDDYLAPASGQVIEAQRTHKAAQVVASLMGRLRGEISDNLSGQTVADQQRLVAYLVSDEILRRGSAVEEALNRERNLNQTADVSAMITAVVEQIDTSELNRNKLEFYADRINRNLEVWDMEPPQIQQRSVAEGAVVSVDAVVAMIFDKALDPASIANDAVSLRRSDGSYVSGVVDYNAELKRLRFVPDRMLLAYSDYEVVVSAHLADNLGNRTAAEQRWPFSTVFDLTPPPLAEIEPEQGDL